MNHHRMAWDKRGLKDHPCGFNVSSVLRIWKQQWCWWGWARFQVIVLFTRVFLCVTQWHLSCLEMLACPTRLFVFQRPFPREVVESPSLQVFKRMWRWCLRTQFRGGLDGCIMVGWWLELILRVFSNLKHSMVLSSALSASIYPPVTNAQVIKCQRTL